MIKKNTDGLALYIPHRQIDKIKWDACVQSSSLPLIYAMSAFLDGMSKHWDALVLGDYEAVMPLPWNRKWLVSYVYSPYFVVAGGVFAKNVSETLFSAFIKAIPKRFRYVDLDLNEHNFFPSLFPGKKVHYQQRRNTFLALNRSYEDISSGYSSQAKRKIKKALQSHFTVDKSNNVNKIIELYQQHYKDKDSVISRYDFTNMIALLSNRLAAQTQTYILSFSNGDVAAFYLLMFDKNYVYWLIGGSSPEGRDAGAFYCMTDIVIQEFAGTGRTLRFEGSDHDGIHFFNQQFGGQTVLYPRIKINRLYWPLKYLK